MLSCVRTVLLLSITIQSIVAPNMKEYERKTGLELEFIKDFGYAGKDMVLRSQLRNLKSGDRAFLCNKALPTKQYTLGNFPLIETHYIEFRRIHNPVLAEVLSCSGRVALFESVHNLGIFYELKNVNSKKLLVRYPLPRDGPYIISKLYGYNPEQMKARNYILPPPIIRPEDAAAYSRRYYTSPASSSRPSLRRQSTFGNINYSRSSSSNQK